jgi:hypothetical protein
MDIEQYLMHMNHVVPHPSEIIFNFFFSDEGLPPNAGVMHGGGGLTPPAKRRNSRLPLVLPVYRRRRD